MIDYKLSLSADNYDLLIRILREVYDSHSVRVSDFISLVEDLGFIDLNDFLKATK